MATAPVENLSPKAYCGECGGAYPLQDLARFGNQFVCANCKPAYIQRMREGVQPIGTPMAGVVYGGFWIRFLAVIIDGIIMGVVIFPISFAVGFGLGRSGGMDPANPPIAQIALLELGILALALVYQVWFNTQKGGTPGKLVLGLRVVTTDGKFMTVPRAIGRFFAYILSGMVFYIGYIIAGFDSEKRALHDHICSTRVIRK
jgi:uncharacterized RDD family membrane protein YckC